MKNFLLFVLALIAIIVLLANLGPMIFLAVCIYLLYVIFKQFSKSESMGAKICWIIVGLIVLSMATANSFAIIGVVALIFLYILLKNHHGEKEVTFNK
ncbi:flagellar basal body rod protein [Evansella sp. AB-P1]|uniref:lmo0954 family membrane protein n=1 Tax=Evansella sp. AB-P1 TaxID=3037653 RepID=UPI00241E955E|nr:flagellar basal body rod protein [Evansella sp. AB-P1]MDG5786876.1 flagellar basal body rod protein [Evansella sp. AB-P1]